MTSPIDPTGYATVEDYELRTGTTVPPEQVDYVQIRLNDNSTMVALYLGECEPDVAGAYPDLLTTLVCTMANQQIERPSGISSATVGATSISFAGSGESPTNWLNPSVTDLLDKLILATCGPTTDTVGVGQFGVGWGGPTEEDYDTLWVLSGPARRN